jgi:hypothetical protein
MERLRDEFEYVVKALRRAREEVTTYPGWFDPDALERIDKAIAVAIEKQRNILQLSKAA